MPDDTPQPRHPVCPSIVICERATIDRVRGRIDMTGAFDMIRTASLPAPLQVYIVFTLTDAQGDYKLELSLEHDQTESTLGRTSKDISFPSPTKFYNDVVPMRFEVWQPGAFTVKLKANGHLVAQRTFTVAVGDGS